MARKKQKNQDLSLKMARKKGKNRPENHKKFEIWLETLNDKIIGIGHWDLH